MKLQFFDNRNVLDGDRVILRIGRLSVFWLGPAWGPARLEIRPNLTDAWVEVVLGKLSLVFYKGEDAQDV